jgi:hypothetical protein
MGLFMVYFWIITGSRANELPRVYLLMAKETIFDFLEKHSISGPVTISEIASPLYRVFTP